MRRLALVWAVLATIACCFAHAQPTAKLYRIGVITQGAVQERFLVSLRAGLKDGGLVERKDYLLHIENVDLLFTINTSVSVVAMRATKDIPGA